MKRKGTQSFLIVISVSIFLGGCTTLKGLTAPNSLKPAGIIGNWKTKPNNPHPSIRISQNQLTLLDSKTGKVRSQLPIQWQATVELPPSNSKCRKTNVKITPVNNNQLSTVWSCKDIKVPPKIIQLHRTK